MVTIRYLLVVCLYASSLLLYFKFLFQLYPKVQRAGAASISRVAILKAAGFIKRPAISCTFLTTSDMTAGLFSNLIL